MTDIKNASKKAFFVDWPLCGKNTVWRSDGMWRQKCNEDALSSFKSGLNRLSNTFERMH